MNPADGTPRNFVARQNLVDRCGSAVIQQAASIKHKF
jgi:hypothetical protein